MNFTTLRNKTMLSHVLLFTSLSIMKVSPLAEESLICCTNMFFSIQLVRVKFSLLTPIDIPLGMFLKAHANQHFET